MRTVLKISGIFSFAVALILSFGFSTRGFKSKFRLNGTDTGVSDTFSISNYKGKIVILNFWASWSKASRTENKNLLRLWQIYRFNPDVRLVSISLDTDEQLWKTAIDEDEMSWKDHFCDFKKYDSPVVKRHGVNTIPRFFVYDKEGKQVYSALNAHDLDDVISGLLK
jgi:thiol-disulfide isomerase/thioredoxin